MKISSRIVFILSSFILLSAGGVTGEVIAASPVSGVIAPAIQRSRPIPAAAAEAGYALIDVVGADDIIEVILRGELVTFKAVKGQNPRSVTADFSSPIPTVPDLIFSVSKLTGRGSVSLTGRPDRSNNYHTVLRVMDSARGSDNYRIRLDWRLPEAGPAPSAPARRTPQRVPEIRKREIASRISDSRVVEQGFVELKLDGVDDIVDVEVSGNSARYLTVRGSSPGKVEAVFSSPVPRDATLSLDIVKSYGRGDIAIAERPSAANNYTATIRLSDSRGGRDNYKFRINWDKSGAVRTMPSARPNSSAGPVPARSGHVEVVVEGADDIVDILISGDQVAQKTIKGGTPRQVKAEFSTPLPRVSLAGLVLRKTAGRGNVVLMEGPDRTNNYTATVRIMDSERAQDDYRFSLSWDIAEGVSEPVDSGYQNYEDAFDSSIGQGNYQGIPSYAGSSFKYTKEGAFEFRAVVDETALVKIEDGRLWGTVLQGQPMRVLDARFSEGYPRGDMERLEITKFRGRGDVEILEKPWSGNNYSIVIRIHDSRGGDDEYGFRLQWKQR